MIDALPTTITRLLDRVHVDPDLNRARFDDHDVTATRPADLTSGLAALLYQVMHVGSPPPSGPQPRLRRDEEYEAVLTHAVPRDHHEVEASVVGGDGYGAGDPIDVVLSGVRVRVPAEQVSGVDSSTGRARLRMPATHAALSPGFLMATHPAVPSFSARNPCLRVYFHVRDPDATPNVWARVLSAVELAGVPYRSKALSNPARYPRQDAIVLYLNGSDWPVVPMVADAGAAGGQLGAGISAFAARVVDGVGWAWDPQDSRPGMQNMSFGEHRAHAIAAGLVSHAAGTGPADRADAVAQALRDAGVVPGAPHRNLTSPPCGLG